MSEHMSVDETYADRANLVPLIERIREAKRADPEIDREIMRVAHVQERRYIGCTCDCCPEGKHLDLVWVNRETDKWVTTGETGFNFTASRDAVHEQIAKRLPKYHVMSGWIAPNDQGVRQYFANLAHDRKPRDTGMLYARSEPLALCLAYLMAEFLETAASLEGPRP
jgi:hypothetical protein